MKSQIESSYSSDKSQQKEVLNELGYTSYFKDAQKNDTEALTNLFYQYQQNKPPVYRENWFQPAHQQNPLPSLQAMPINFVLATFRRSHLKAQKTTTAEAVQACNDHFC